MDRMNFTSMIERDLHIDGRRVRVVCGGDRGPDLVLLHGLPTHAGLWRHVQPGLSSVARTWAIDLPGFGASDPIGRQDDLAALADALDAVLRQLAISRPIFVALDLGLLVALQWAARHPDRVLGLVMMEGFFLPMRVAWKRLPLGVRTMMRLARWPWLAERAMVRDPVAVERFVRGSVSRRMTGAELAAYAAPWADPARRRRVWLGGIHAGRLVPPSRSRGDVVELVDAAAAALHRSEFEKLLLTATPGTVVTPEIAAEAKRRLRNLRVVPVGSGKHLLPEDQPAAITAAVSDFAVRISSSNSGGQ